MNKNNTLTHAQCQVMVLVSWFWTKYSISFFSSKKITNLLEIWYFQLI